MTDKNRGILKIVALILIIAGWVVLIINWNKNNAVWRSTSIALFVTGMIALFISGRKPSTAVVNENVTNNNPS